MLILKIFSLTESAATAGGAVDADSVDDRIGAADAEESAAGAPIDVDGWGDAD